MYLHDLIVPLGITTFTMLVITVISGLKRWKFKYHKRLALTTLFLAACHALIVIISG